MDSRDLKTIMYNLDFSKWLFIQIGHLQNNQFDQLDITNLVEELQGIEVSLRLELHHYYHSMVVAFILSNDSEYEDNKAKIKDILESSPSLKDYLETYASRNDVWEATVKQASYLTSGRFPDKCPYSLDMLLNSENKNDNS